MGLRQLFRQIDENHSGEITIDELEDMHQRSDFHAYFTSLGLQSEDAWSLFKLLDRDRNGRLSVDEFVSGCLQLKGPATAIQCAILENNHKMTRRMLQKVIAKLTFLTESVDTRSFQSDDRLTRG